MTLSRRDFVAASVATGATLMAADSRASADRNAIYKEIDKRRDESVTSATAPLIVAQRAVYKAAGIDPLLWPRSGGSWPGSVFTGDPLKLPAGHFGMGYGDGAHAPNEFYVIESSNSKIGGMATATRSFVDYLYALA